MFYSIRSNVTSEQWAIVFVLAMAQIGLYQVYIVRLKSEMMMSFLWIINVTDNINPGINVLSHIFECDVTTMGYIV